MNSTGYNSGETNESKTLIDKLRSLRDRYHTQASVILAIIAITVFTLAQIIPEVEGYIIKTGFIEFLILIVVLDLSVEIHTSKPSSTTRLAKNQDETMPILINAVSHCRTEGIDLLEYAGYTTVPLIRAIRREGAPLRMLVQHPDLITGSQKQRNIVTLDTIYNSIYADSSNSPIEIRCYRVPYTLRGRRIGGLLLELGWLTPDFARNTAYGHGNPSVLADLSTSQNEHLLDFFTRTFNDLWTAPDTEDGRAVLNRYLTASSV